MTGITYAMNHGPYTNNGASPWYATVNVGSENTPMKLAMDTGTNMTWVTSIECTTEPCMLPTRTRFDPNVPNSTFCWIDSTPKPFNYGPWGDLMASMGNDFLKNPNVSVLYKRAINNEYMKNHDFSLLELRI